MKSIPSLNPNKTENWTKLRVILSALIVDYLIEERHALDGDEKRVDYSIENKGIELLEKFPDELKITKEKSVKNKIGG